MTNAPKKGSSMKKTILFIIGLFCITMNTHAEESGQAPHLMEIPYNGTSHYLLADLGAGLHTLLYYPQGVENSTGVGGLFELRYQYIPNHIGFGAGIQLCSHRSKATMNYSFSEEIRHDDNNLECIKTTEFHNWTEKQEIMTLEVPMMFQYQTNLSEKWSLSLGAGVVVSIPIRGKYEVESGYLETFGYFGSTNIVYKDLDNHGFLVDKDKAEEKIENLRCNIGLQGEIGILRNIKEKIALHIGLYVNYGLSDCTKEESKALFSQDGYTGILSCDMTHETHLLKTGAKIGLRFNLRDKVRESEAIKQANELQAQKELEKEVKNTAVRMEEERLERIKQAQIKEEEERERILEEEKIAAEKRIRAAMAELRDANMALRNIRDNAEYKFFGAVPTFPEEIENSFDVVFQYLAKNPNTYIKVTGHTDNTKTEMQSMEIGQRKAEAFKKALVMKGISEERIECASKGYFEPIASNNTKEGRRINNRTDLRIQERQSATPLE